MVLDFLIIVYESVVRSKASMLQNIPRKFDKITQSTRVCIKHFEDKDVHSFNIYTNPVGTTYTVSNVVLNKLFYCTLMYYYEYKNYVKYVIILFVNYIP